MDWFSKRLGISKNTIEIIPVNSTNQQKVAVSPVTARENFEPILYFL
jgi:hypothetical protein